MAKQNTQFDLQNFLDSIFEKLPQEKQSTKLYEQMQNHLHRIVVSALSNFIAPQEMAAFLENPNFNDGSAGEMIEKYIAEHPKLEEILMGEMEHFKNMINSFTTK